MMPEPQLKSMRTPAGRTKNGSTPNSFLVCVFGSTILTTPDQCNTPCQRTRRRTEPKPLQHPLTGFGELDFLGRVAVIEAIGIMDTDPLHFGVTKVRLIRLVRVLRRLRNQRLEP